MKNGNYTEGKTTMNEADWYELVDGPSLMQGDILKACPAFQVRHPSNWPFPLGANLEVEACTIDLVLMTQSCDLEHAKVQEVLLARLLSWTEVLRGEVARGNEAAKSSRFRR